MANPTDYTGSGSSSSTSAGGAGTGEDGYSVAKLRQQYLDFQSAKINEIEEQRTARHYYAGDQLTKEELAILERRGQPATIRDKVSRKINGVVGLVERLRQDPKAFPRTPQHEEGAEIATAAIRYVCDTNHWEVESSGAARVGSINGIFGVELDLQTGDQGDPDVAFHPVDPDTFFYDPRSYRFDFSDARYMGVAKWIDLDVMKEMFPGQDEVLEGLVTSGPGMESYQQQDRDYKWIDSKNKRLFLVEHWHIWKGEWRVCYYVGDTKLATHPSPFFDEKGKTICRYIMGSVNVDHDGDRYGFIRLLKSLVDELNALVSKRAHLINVRRIIAEKGAVADVDTARREAVRADGYLEVHPGKRFEFDDQSRLANIEHINRAIEEVKTEIENFGPNPALVGQGLEAKSGRAIALLQQAGIAELGPFILAYRGWKIRVYRAIWNAVQRYWKAERWIRVTDDEGLAQFVQLNGLQMDQFGQVSIANALGSLDVDILIDEGPDTINLMQDSYDALTALAQSGAEIPPQVLIELSPLQSSVKRKVLGLVEQSQQPSEFDQTVMQGKVAELAGKARKVNAEATKIEGEAETQPMKDRAQAWRDVSSGAATIAKARQPQAMPPDGF